MRPRITAIATGGKGGFAYYSTPALAKTASGRLLCAYEAHPQPRKLGDLPTWEGVPGAKTLLRTSDDQGFTWSDPQELGSSAFLGDNTGQGCPSFIVDFVTGRVYLMSSLRLSPLSNDDVASGGTDGSTVHTDSSSPQEHLHIALSYSDDDGETWRAHTVTTQITAANTWKARLASPGHGIQLQHSQWAGRLVQAAIIQDEQGVLRFVSICSDDHGTSWFAGQPVGENAQLCSITELVDGRLLMRSYSNIDEDYELSWFSADGGRTWADEWHWPATMGALDSDSAEPAFPDAPANSPQAKIFCYPMLQHEDTEFNAILKVSLDGQNTWPIQTPVNNECCYYPDIVGLPQYRLLVGAYQNTAGIAFIHVPYDHIGIGEYAHDWMNPKDVQDEFLRRHGFLQ